MSESLTRARSPFSASFQTLCLTARTDLNTDRLFCSLAIELAAFYAFGNTWAKSKSLSTHQSEKKQIQEEKKKEDRDRFMLEIA